MKANAFVFKRKPRVTTDKYALCPCKSGKKFKFCCMKGKKDDQDLHNL